MAALVKSSHAAALTPESASKRPVFSAVVSASTEMLLRSTGRYWLRLNLPY